MRARLALPTLLLAFACGSDVAPPEPTATDLAPDSFRGVLVELAVARVATLPDTQAWLGERAAILERHGVDGDDLRSFVDAYGRDDEVMEGIYRTLGASLDSIARLRTIEEAEAREAADDAFPSPEETAGAGDAVDTTGSADPSDAGPGSTP